MILSKYRILIFISFLVFLPLESIQTEEFIVSKNKINIVNFLKKILIKIT